MTGWRHVGRVGEPGERLPAGLPRDSIVALSAYEDGPLRCGVMSTNATGPMWLWPITGACVGDHVFVATALGEHAFRPSTPAASD